MEEKLDLGPGCVYRTIGLLVLLGAQVLLQARKPKSVLKILVRRAPPAVSTFVSIGTGHKSSIWESLGKLFLCFWWGTSLCASGSSLWSVWTCSAGRSWDCSLSASHRCHWREKKSAVLPCCLCGVSLTRWSKNSLGTLAIISSVFAEEEAAKGENTSRLSRD